MADKNSSRTTASPSTENTGNTGAPVRPSDDLGADELQQAFDKAEEQGFFGTEVDQTPNEAYTLQGGPAGEGTPEGDRMLGKTEKKG